MSDRHDEGGFSLVEVLVAMALTSVVLLALGLVFNSTLRTTSKITVRSDTTFDAREAVDAMSRRVRVAYRALPDTSAFLTMKPDEMSFYASINGGATGIVAPKAVNPAPTIVTYRLVDVTRDGRATKCLQESLVTARGDGTSFSFTPPAASRSMCLAYGDISGNVVVKRDASGRILSAVKQPSFLYFTDNTDVTEPGAAKTTDPCSVTSVQIGVRVSQPSGGDAVSTEASSRVVASNITATSCSGGTP